MDRYGRPNATFGDARPLSHPYGTLMAKEARVIKLGSSTSYSAGRPRAGRPSETFCTVNANTLAFESVDHDSACYLP